MSDTLRATNVHLRPYRPEDLDTICMVWWRAWHSAFPGVDHPQAFEQWHARLRDVLIPQGTTWVAEMAGRVAGFLLLTDGGSYLSQLFVDPDVQRQGIGALLLDRAKVLSPAGLTLGTAQRNLAARRFYERHGFHVVATGVGGIIPQANVTYRWDPPPP